GSRRSPSLRYPAPLSAPAWPPPPRSRRYLQSSRSTPRGPTPSRRCRASSRPGAASNSEAGTRRRSRLPSNTSVTLQRGLVRSSAKAGAGRGRRSARPGGRVIVDAHLEHEIGRRAEADALDLRDARRVAGECLAHIVLAAEMVGRAGRPVAAIDGAA